MRLLEWSNWEVFNAYTGRVAVAFKGLGLWAYLITIWYGAPFDYEDMNTPYVILPIDND